MLRGRPSARWRRRWACRFGRGSTFRRPKFHVHIGSHLVDPVDLSWLTGVPPAAAAVGPPMSTSFFGAVAPVSVPAAKSACVLENRL